MMRVATLALAWLAAAAAALVVAWQGVAVVDRQVTDERPAPLSAGEIQAALGAGQTGADESGTGTDTRSGSADEDEEDDQDDGSGTTTTSPPGSAGGSEPLETRTYRLTGGTVALQFAPSAVTLLSADPRVGFAVDSEREGDRIRVEFESEDHESRVDAWWDGGPQDEVREEPESSDSESSDDGD